LACFKDRVDPKTKYRCPFIEALRADERPRASVWNLVANPASKFTLEIFRIGFLHAGGTGAGKRFLGRLGPFKGKKSSLAEIGKIVCSRVPWEPAAASNSARLMGHVLRWQLNGGTRGCKVSIFLCRRAPRRPLSFILSEHTWQAYQSLPRIRALRHSRELVLGSAAWTSVSTGLGKILPEFSIKPLSIVR